MMDLALEYAAMGYPVLPLVGKRPAPQLVPQGKTNATTNPETIRGWFGRNSFNLGIVPPSSVVVLDVDEPEVLPDLFQRYPGLEHAPHTLTGSGGSHIYLALPSDTQLAATVRALKGVDLRGMNKAYLVAPPSIHPDTSRLYSWINPLVKPEDLPAIPSTLLQRLVQSPKPTSAPITYVPTFTASRGRLGGLLEWACEQIAIAPEGQRHQTLFRFARLTGGWLHHGLEEAQALEALTAAGMRAGLSFKEASTTARDGVRYGISKPVSLRDAAPSRVRTRSSRLRRRWRSL